MNEHKGTGLLRSDSVIDAQLRNDLGASPLPGSDGEHRLKQVYGRTGNVLAFYRNQVLDYLNSAMQVFIARQELMFVATADRHGDAGACFSASRQRRGHPWRLASRKLYPSVSETFLTGAHGI